MVEVQHFKKSFRQTAKEISHSHEYSMDYMVLYLYFGGMPARASERASVRAQQRRLEREIECQREMEDVLWAHTFAQFINRALRVAETNLSKPIVAFFLCVRVSVRLNSCAPCAPLHSLLLAVSHFLVRCTSQVCGYIVYSTSTIIHRNINCDSFSLDDWLTIEECLGRCGGDDGGGSGKMKELKCHSIRNRTQL